MDHASPSRAPQPGSPPSPDWSLHKISSSEPTSGLAQFSVLDAVGVRLGAVSGWVYTPDGHVAGLSVGLRGFFKAHYYLIPLGYVTQIDPRHRTLHLREITRRSLPQVAVRCDDTLPPAEVLETVLREAPNPRPAIVSMLRQPESGPLFSHTPAPPRQGDGHRHPPALPVPHVAPPPARSADAPAPPSLPRWQTLAVLAGEDEELPARWL